MHLLTAAFIALLAASQAAAFSCGANRFQNYVANIFIMLDCHSRLPQFDTCCRAHDSCYDAQAGKDACDNHFCACLRLAASGTRLCGTDASAFCMAVRRFGGGAYENAGRNRG